MEVLQSNKKYAVTDFIWIPLRICPVLVLVKGTNRLIGALILSLQILVTADFIDTALSVFHKQTEYFHILSPLLLLAAIVVYNYLNWSLMSYVNLRFEMKMTQVFRTAMVEKRSCLAYRHIENSDTWDLIVRTCSDPVGRISGGLNNLLGAVDILVRIVSVLTILMTQVWWVALTVIGISVPLFWLAFQGGKANYRANREAEKYNRRAGYLHGVLSSRDTVEERTLFGYSPALNYKWHEKYERARKINLIVSLKNFIRMKGASLITVLFSALIIGVLLIPLSHAEITIGMFMGLVTATLGLVQMMSWQLSDITRRFADNREYLKDLTDFMALSETQGALDPPLHKEGFCFESLEFSHVSFRYPGTDHYILKDFSLRIEKNRHVAFVGINGAGKTTVTKLLTGLYDEFEGEIFINGKSIREYHFAELKALFAVVYQDFARYAISLKDNIALGDIQGANDGGIMEAASKIGLGSVIERLPLGVKTPLGKVYEDSADLSGGEWQRVAIARALCSPAAVQILDEPTAALDPVAESDIYTLFGQISTDKTTILITHRLGAARMADEIIVIENGRVAERGSHEELMQKGGIYAEMFESQRSWYQ